MSIWDNLIDGQKEDLKKFAKEFEAFRKTIDKASDEITKSVQTITEQPTKTYTVTFCKNAPRVEEITVTFNLSAPNLASAAEKGWEYLNKAIDISYSSWRLDEVKELAT